MKVLDLSHGWTSYGGSSTPSYTTTTPSETCPAGWINAGHLGCFFFDNSKPDRDLTWVEAVDVCSSFGGYLAEINSEEQAEFLVKKLYP